MTSFDLPLSSGGLFLISRGASGGTVNIVQSDFVEDGNVARVVVTAKHRHTTAFASIKVCAVARGEMEYGVGIFVSSLPLLRESPQSILKSQPNEWIAHSYVNFEVTLYLPKAQSGGTTLHIGALAIDMPHFAYTVGDIGKVVNFDAVTFKTANMPISVGVSVKFRWSVMSAKINMRYLL